MAMVCTMGQRGRAGPRAGGLPAQRPVDFVPVRRKVGQASYTNSDTKSKKPHIQFVVELSLRILVEQEWVNMAEQDYVQMPALEVYSERFKNFFKFKRSEDGILEVRMHTF